MEGGGGSCRDLINKLIGELTHGKELTRQLESHMQQLFSPTDEQYYYCKDLVQSLLCTWDKAICMARSSSEYSDGERPLAISLSGSPRSEGSEFQAPKRKTLPKMTRRVRVVDPASTGLEGPLDDGFSWRKYGQKDILGAKHPRSYYRCTHRHTHGCPALKQVQRSHDDPSVFDVTYRGHHTCILGDLITIAADTSAAVAAEQQQQQQGEEIQEHKHFQVNNAAVDENESLLLGFRRRQLTVKTEGLDGGGLLPFPSPSFSFSSTSVGWASPPAAVFDSPFTGGGFSPPFVSPRASSDSTGFPAPPGQVGGWQAPPLPGPGFAEAFRTEATASSSGEYLFMVEPSESDPNYPFYSSFSPNQFH